MDRSRFMRPGRLDRFAVAHPIRAYFCLAGAEIVVFMLVALTTRGWVYWPLAVFWVVFFPAMLVWSTRRRERQRTAPHPGNGY
jgi:Flp pilus assembly protein TadB